MILKIFDILFPPHCSLCHKKGTYLCDSCLNNIPKRKNFLVSDSIYALYSYKEPSIKKALWNLKYRGVKEYGTIFAPSLYSLLCEVSPQEEPVVLVPIPSTKRNHLRRGFNQAEFFAHEVEKLNPDWISVKTILKKKKGTKPQTNFKKRTGRIENIIGSYEVVNKNPLSGTIVLIDDITTTGATLRESMKTLKENGVQNVYAITLAHQELF